VCKLVQALSHRVGAGNLDEIAALEVGYARCDGRSQRLQTREVFGLAALEQTQSVADYFAGVLVAPGGDKRPDQLRLGVGQDHVTCRHDTIYRSAILAESANSKGASGEMT